MKFHKSASLLFGGILDPHGACMSSMILSPTGWALGKLLLSLISLVKLATAALALAVSTSALAENPQRQAYFGDLHVHTRFSFDAFIFGTRTNPDDAYDFAKGKILIHAAGHPMQLKAPLDFQAVTDHATYLGMLEKMEDESSTVADHPLSVQLRG